MKNDFLNYYKFVFNSIFYGESTDIPSAAYSGSLVAFDCNSIGVILPSPLQLMQVTNPLPWHNVHCDPLAILVLPKHNPHNISPFPMQYGQNSSSVLSCTFLNSNKNITDITPTVPPTNASENPCITPPTSIADIA